MRLEKILLDIVHGKRTMMDQDRWPPRRWRQMERHQRKI